MNHLVQSPEGERTSSAAESNASPRPVHRWVEDQAREHPTRTALCAEDDAWTYQALNRRANQVAHCLRHAGLGREDPVGVHMDRSLYLVASLLGTLKAGTAYVALPPSLPTDRLRFMADDAGVAALLTADSGAAISTGNVPSIDVTGAAVADAKRDAPDVTVRPEHLAYILYTSGTTGRPKGVMQPHRALQHHARVFVREVGELAPDRTVLFKSSYTFDLSISELFPALTEGATVALAPPEARGVKRLVETIQAHGVTDVFVTPTRLRLLMDREGFRTCDTVERIYSAGEALSGDLRDAFLDQFDAALYNLYGTTEMCCGQTGLDCSIEAETTDVTTIGHPWTGYDAYVTDAILTPTNGDPGELVIGGVGEARGYRGMPRETALRFVPDALSGRRGARVYRTGDRARRTEAGRIEYRGREDDQLQIRGVRIETGEVEATIAEAEKVELAAVRPLNERSGKADGLVAYVVPVAETTLDPVALTDWCEAHVPGPAVPRSVEILDEMPLQPSGKIDRPALPDPESITERADDGTPPQTAVQRAIAAIWASHLDVERVGIHENFFRIGGHSLLAVRIQHDIAEELGAEVSLQTFLDAPTVADLADAVEPQEGAGHAPIERHDYEDEAPLSASQRRMWLLQTLNPDSVAYNVPATVRLNRHVDLDAFHRALTRLVERHEILRTVFPEREGDPIQKIQPAQDPVPWTVTDLTAASDPEAEAQALIDRRIRTPFDLTEETPLRLSLFKVSDEEWLFCPFFHHIAIDEWTFGILLDDLEALYRAERSRPHDAGPLSLSNTRRTEAWQDAHEVLHQDLSPQTADDPTLNTTGWVSSYDGDPFSEAEMRDWLRGCIAPLRRLDLGRTLEIGAGTGMLLFRLAPDAEEYVGVDFSKQALKFIDVVREDLDADLSNVTLVHGRADEVSGLSGTFDTIILNSVVQYFPDHSYLDAVLRAAADRLRAPGTMYLGDLRDRRLAYAFHADTQRAQASAERSRPSLQDDVQQALTQDDELLVDPQSLVRVAKGLPGITDVDLTLPRAEHTTEMSAFRYGALLHARPHTPPARPDAVLPWNETDRSLSSLRSRLEEHDGVLLVTGLPNARVWTPLHLQHWLHRSGEPAPLSSFSPPSDTPALDPDALRAVGKETGHRVTTSPSTDPAGRTFDAVFEPHSDGRSTPRPLTPLSAEASASRVPPPMPIRSADDVPPGPSASLWRTLTDQTAADRDVQDRGSPGPAAPPIQYADYALWQADRLQGDRYEEALDEWVEALDGVPERLNWPFDGFDRDREFGPAETVELHLDDDLGAQLRACAGRQGTTVPVVFLSAFALLLARYTGQSDMTVGMPVTNRDHPELDRLVGMLLNTLPFPVHLEATDGFDAFVERLGNDWRKAMARNWVPFEEIVEAVGAGRPADQLPLLDVMFTYVPAGRRERRLGTLGEVERDPIGFDLPEALCPLFLIVTETEDGYRARFRYDTHRFDDSIVRRLSEHFERLLTAGLDAPEVPLEDLPMLRPEETHRLSEAWAKGPRIDVPQMPVHRLFEEKAARHPDRTAIVGVEETWTYDALNRRANQLAHRLRADGVGPGVPVGVHMKRSPSLLAALLGVLKAGGAYVSLPPSLPEHRLRYTIRNAGVDRTVVHGPTQTDIGVPHIDLDTLGDNDPTDNLSVDIPPQALAYILYTSGSTGRPKGVMVPHAAVTDLLIVMKTHFPAGKNDAVLLKTPYSFDVSVSEIFNPLVAGAQLVLTPTGAEKNPRYLVERIRKTDATVLRMTPTELANLLQAEGAEACDSIRRVFAAGAALTPAVRDAFYETWTDAELINLWGPTEACVYGSWWPCRAESDADEVPIGWPLSNASLYSLDEAMDLTPARVQGDLYAGGPGLAHGYRGRPRETADAYRPNPYAEERGARLYKTGDLVRWAEDGHLHFLGRKDNQIQLRGIRVELGEIEAHLEKAPAVRHAAVRPFEGEDGRIESLVAYVVTGEAHDLDAKALRTHLGDYLPSSVVPGRYVEVPEMPRSAAGKIDRDGLPDPETHVRTVEDDHLQTSAERLIASIWRDVLDLDTVTRHGNFFEFGGNSLAAVKVHRRLQRQFDKEIELVHLFEHTTVAQLADFLDEPGDFAEEAESPQAERGRTRRNRLQQQQRRRSDQDD